MLALLENCYGKSKFNSHLILHPKLQKSEKILQYAYLGDCDKVIDEVKKGANPNLTTPWKETPLIYMSKYNCPKAVAILLKNKADVNYIDQNGFTALLHAGTVYLGSKISFAKRQKRFTQIVKSLVQAGAKINIKSNNGNYLLRLVGCEGSLEVFNYLMKRGIKKEQVSGALVCAIRWKYKELYEHIFKKYMQYVNINYQFMGYETALIAASIWKGNLPLVKKLVTLGADFNQKGKDRGSAIETAKKRGNTEIYNYLRSLKN